MSEYWYPDILKNDQSFPASILFSFYKRDAPDKSSPTDNIHLYMPEQFEQTQSISWEDISLLSAGKEAVAKGIDVVASGMRNGITKSLMTFLSGAANMSNNPTLDLINNKFISKTVNGYMSKMFRGVDFRSYGYSFKFVPFSETDCDTIQNIINTFRKNALPVKSGVGGSVLNYPGEVEIEYQWMNGNNKYIHKCKRSVITSINIGYTGAGMWGMMRNRISCRNNINHFFN